MFIRLGAFGIVLCAVLISSGVKLTRYEASAILAPIVEKVDSSIQGTILSTNDVADDSRFIIL